jgi:hypothetical protein
MTERQRVIQTRDRTTSNDGTITSAEKGSRQKRKVLFKRKQSVSNTWERA